MESKQNKIEPGTILNVQGEYRASPSFGIMRCKNCIHWKHDDENGAYCDSPKKKGAAYALDSALELHGDECAVDGECYPGKLYTGPEFGCVHFELTEDE